MLGEAGRRPTIPPASPSLRLVDGDPLEREAGWWLGLPLVDRLRSPPAAVSPDLPRRAERRLARWRTQSPFQDEAWFAHRLAADGLTVERFVALLGESAASLAARVPAPEWWEVARRSFAAAADRPLPADLVPPGAPPAQSFLWLVAPLWHDARQTLAERIDALCREHPGAPFDGGIVDLLLAPVRERLAAMLGRTAVLELNVAREEGRLDGATPEDRFADFIAQIARPDVAFDLLSEYPVLVRQAVVWLEDAGTAAAELAARLAADWPSLVDELFAGRDPGRLVELRAGGDRHRGGRCVALCRFASGERLVYKPRPLAVDRLFGELVSWLHLRDGIDLRCPRVLDRGDYGWSEHIAAAGCEDRDALLRFYRRQGAFLAVLHLLHATDFHSENLIAAGEHPVPIDFESLLRGTLAEAAGAAVPPAVEALAGSVLMVGLLPQRIWRGKDEQGTETSGLGGEAGQRSSRPVPLWEDSGTDRMRLVRRYLPLAAAQNRPRLGGEEVDPLEFSQAIEGGFRDTYRLLASLSEELLAADGPLDRFAGAEMRTILRHTQLYDLVLNESFHPDVLRDAIDRELLFDRLWYRIGDRPGEGCFEAVIPAERADLWRGDIPFFTAAADGLALRDSRGRTANETFFSESGLDRCRRRLRGFDERELERQLWFLDAAMSTLSSRERGGPAWEPPKLPPAPAAPEALLAEARRLGDRLAHLAIVRGDQAGWLGLVLVRGEHWAPASLGVDLYGGMPGIVLFLAYLADATGETGYRDLAERGLVGIRRQVEAIGGRLTSPAAFQGLAGLAYLDLHLAALWRREDLLAEALALVPAIAAAEEVEQDVVGGAAGMIPVLLHLHDATGDARPLAAAHRMGEHLLAAARPVEGGIGWLTVVDERRPLAGFSHGASGCAWALTELWARCGDERLRTAARDGLAAERLAFSSEEGNWRDLRGIDDETPGTPPRFMIAWCHGAAGVGLARARMLRHLPDPTLRDELLVAVRTTANRGFGTGHSLCHGDLGNLELLHEAEAVLPPAELPRLSGRFAAAVLDSIARRGWRCGVPMEVETPGLMVGLAGIGLGLLRAARPAAVPNVLLLDPPPAGAAA